MSWHPLGPDPEAHVYELSQDEMMTILSGKTTPEKIKNRRETELRIKKTAEDKWWLRINFALYLTHLGTRELLGLLHQTRVNDMLYVRGLGSKSDFQYTGYLHPDDGFRSPHEYRDDIKNELHKRPHVGRDKKSRALAAKQNRGQNKSKNR